MKHERTKLFTDQLRALIDYLGFEYPEDNISIIHIGKDEGDRDMYFVSTFPVDNRFQMLIVYWNGVDMYYEEINDAPDLFEYEPKKSLKDECLELMADLENTVLHLQSWPAAKHHLPLNIKLLRKTIEAMEDNT